MKLTMAILILALFTTAGCGTMERWGAKLKGHTSLCIDGVTYYQFASGAAVARNPDGSVKTCD